jgi:hypothetical protein
MIENKTLKKKKFPPKQPKNQIQNFEKHLKEKRCAIRHLIVPNFCYF